MKKYWFLWLSACLVILCGCTQQETPAAVLESASLSCENEEIFVDETAMITYAITPSDVHLKNEDIYASGGTITLQDGVIQFQSEESGIFEIFLSKDDVKSNTITILVEKRPSSDAQEKDQRKEDPSTTAPIEEGTPHNAPMSVDWLITNAKYYVDTDTSVWVQGDLPQALIEDENGKLQCVIYNEDHSQYIILHGDIGIGNMHVAVLGTLSRNENGKYVIDVDSVSPFTAMETTN